MSVSVSVGARMIERGGADGRREADFAVSSARRKRATAWGSRNHYGCYSRVHAEELARFEALVVRGPGADDCAIWKAAIGGDGYGRYWVRRGCGERIMVRANRYALAAAQAGQPLEPVVRALHGCDNPVRVRVSERGETGLLHVVGGTQRDNMEMMGRARRGGGRPVVRRGIAGLAQRRARAVALRDAVRDGWDADAVAQALLTLREPTLW